MIDGHAASVDILYLKEKVLQKVRLLDELLENEEKVWKAKLGFIKIKWLKNKA